MLHKQRSPKIAVLKYGLVVPLLAIALIMSSATIRSNEKIKEIANNIPLNTPIEVITDVVKESIKPIAPSAAPLKMGKNLNEGKVKAQPEWEAFYRFIKGMVRYPAVAQRDKIQGTTMIKFTIANGQVENIGIATKLAGGCDDEALRRVVLYPGYKAIKDGKYALKITFLLDGANTPLLNEKITPLKGYTDLNKITVTAYGEPSVANADNDTKIHDFISIDTAPSFPGGMSKFYDYLKDNIKYPAEAVKNNVQGKVYMSFVVEKDGSLADFRIERGLGSGTDEEALRVMKESPKWTPGTMGGKAVRVKYNIPIGFSKGPAQSINPENKQGSTSPTGKGIGIRFSDDKGSELKLGDNPKNDPLVILDGKTIDMAEMKGMDPNKIESISVVKDAKATSIYGLKGVNGVIIIRSKTNPLNEITIKQEKKEKKDQ